MARRVSFIAGLFLLFSLTAHAQDSVQVFGGYSFMHYGTTPSFNTNGWEISGEYKLFPWIGVFGDVDGHYGTFENVSSTTNDFLLGPQVSWNARISPFAHAMIGEARFSGGGVTSSGLASGFGFGIDDRLMPLISWRVIQFDLVHTHLFRTGQSNMRVSTGIVIHF